jgi:sRNA-binding protein
VAAVLVSGPTLADDAKVLRDPTRPYNARSVVAATTGGAKVASTFRVTAIFTSDMRRIAVVNGLRVTEGDKVGGATVVEILADRLRLSLGDKAITSRVLPYGFRK